MSIKSVERGDRGKVIDLNTGKELVGVFWVDDTDSPWGHEYKQYVMNDNGTPQLLIPDNPAMGLMTRHVKGAKIRYIPPEQPK